MTQWGRSFMVGSSSPIMANNNGSMAASAVNPLYVRARDQPEGTTIRELCLAAEDVSGNKTIDGAQLLYGLYKLYALKDNARPDLLLAGMSVRGKAVTIFDSNPYQVMDDSGKARPTMRLLVSDLPLEFPTSELENALTKLGCELASKTLFELERDQFNRLTRFKNGRRFVYILVPGKPLPRTVTIHG